MCATVKHFFLAFCFFLVVGAVLPAWAVPNIWTASADRYWTNAANWSLSAEPGSGDTAVFTNTAAAAVGVVTCTVDVSRVVGALSFVPNNVFHHGIQINSGVTLTLSSLLANNLIGDNSTLTITNGPGGGGTLQVGTGLSTDSFKVGGYYNKYTTLDMRGLDTLIANVNAFGVGVTGAIRSGHLYLATTNTITASTFDVGNAAASEIYGASLYLGQTNVINSTTITIGNSKNVGTVKFRSGLNNPTVTIRGTNGISRVDLMIATATANNSSGTMDLTTSTSGSVDAKIGTLIMGKTTGAGAATATLKWASGIVDATTVSNGVSSASAAGTGTMSLSSNAVLIAGILTLGSKLSTGAAIGTLTMTNQAVLQATTLQKGAGTGGTNAIFRWDAGTVQNKSGTDLNLLALSDTLYINLRGAGPHTFIADPGQTITVQNTCILTNNGALIKDGAGVLVMSGANTYSGGTTVSNGTLRVGCDNAMLANSALILSGGTFDAGSYSNAFGTLTLSSNTASSIAVNTGSCMLSFTNMSAVGTGTLTISGKLGATSLRFGTDENGLTKSQLGQILINNKKGFLDNQGYLYTSAGSTIIIL